VRTADASRRGPAAGDRSSVHQRNRPRRRAADTIAYEIEAVAKPTTQLDLAGRIDAIAELAEVGAITPADAAREAAAARTMAPRFGPVTTVIGYTITTLGFGMVINPTWASLWGYVFLGAVVGSIAMLGRPFPTLNAVLPTLAATVVTVLATWFVADAANDGLLRVISPPWWLSCRAWR
jgi:uncharacterized membrane protein YjjP (DUF1212 family)